MCYVQNEDHRLIVTTSGVTNSVAKYYVRDTTLKRISNEIRAYCIDTGKLKWIVRGKLLGEAAQELCAESIATDGRIHLLMCDTNNSCMHMFSVNGKYMGVLLREGQYNLGKPGIIRWCDSSSSLIVARK